MDSELVSDTRKDMKGMSGRKAPGEVVMSCCNNSMLKPTKDS